LVPLSADALQVRGLKPGEGYLVGSFQTLSATPTGGLKPALGNGRVWVRGTGAAQGNVALLEQPKEPTADPVELLVIPAPAGDYEITEWSMSGQAVAANAVVTNRGPLHVPLQVRAGEATYVGRVNVIAANGSFFGRKILQGGTVLITDEFATDEPRLAKRYPMIHRSSFKRSDVPRLYQVDMERVEKAPRPLFY
jgi:hypothetical protein